MLGIPVRGSTYPGILADIRLDPAIHACKDVNLHWRAVDFLHVKRHRHRSG